MKKMNKKGFTLIELLAVIIIIGVLMIIAIPAVTRYIENSRKSTYVDTAVNFIDGVRNQIAEGKKLKLYDTSTLYLIPVGDKLADDDGSSCVAVETGGATPFGDEWVYAYVGVTYNGEKHSYYYISEDDSVKGMPLISRSNLADNGTDKLYSGAKEAESAGVLGSLRTKLSTAYAAKDTRVHSTETDPTPTLTFSEDEISYLQGVVGADKTNFVIIGGCEYSATYTG